MIDVVRQRGTVAELHGRDPFAEPGPVAPVIWWCDQTDDAIVLGSRQPASVVDPVACAAAGLAVVRRRSGGGAVVLRRPAVHWVDFVLPNGFGPDDVRGSMEWIGEHWRRALDGTGRSLQVHRGGMVCSAWSDLVCFSGVGPGEVVDGGVKLVGLSQRRTRHGVRIQALVYAASAAHEYRALFTGQVPDHDPTGQGWIADLDIERVVADLASTITPV